MSHCCLQNRGVEISFVRDIELQAAVQKLAGWFDQIEKLIACEWSWIENILWLEIKSPYNVEHIV